MSCSELARFRFEGLVVTERERRGTNFDQTHRIK